MSREGITDRLRRDVTIIGKTLLPDISPVLEATHEEKIRIRAYVVLAHSAIEEFLEELIDNAVENVLACADSVSVAAISLSVAYADIVIGQHGSKTLTARDAHGKLLGLFRVKAIKTNNGIRRNNIKSLCRPLGIDVSNLEATLDAALTTLDTLGAKRGAAAHTLRQATEEIVVPSQAIEWVDNALNALDILGAYLMEEISRRRFD
ncbi:HEPN domain-containing protein [Amycolatopsis sp. CA-230715]|uniref:HEPN domain-containing protein n=1 Tax=Amycolatopsis sp. CA-230715 TaxID=2745196 RepID=UPI001C010846|nr:HEPN domain-containing protein [Amycolatopsis sp. CA-230715]